MANTNCLQGFKCPKADCGQTECFSIYASALFRVSDDGTEEYESVEWDANSQCYCRQCGQAGIVSDFAPERYPKITRVLVALDIAGNPADALAAVNLALDKGFIQDQINEDYAETLSVVNALVLP